MFVCEGSLVLRSATPADAPALCAWWNDGAVMAHAGFPDGLGMTEEKIVFQLEPETGKTDRAQLIIEYEGRAIGEASYRLLDSRTAEAGWKICDTAYQNRGLGTRVILMTMGYLLTDPVFQALHAVNRVCWDTNLNNLRAQHVYEEKIKAQRTGVLKDNWRDQRGVLQSTVTYELCLEDYLTHHG